MITKAILTYSDGSEATFVGEPVILTDLPLLSSEEQVAPEASTDVPVVEEASVETPVEEPVTDEAAPAETATAE